MGMEINANKPLPIKEREEVIRTVTAATIYKSMFLFKSFNPLL